MNLNHVINQVKEKSAEKNKSLYGAFIDYGKSFDKVNRAAVMEVLRDQGIDETDIGLLKVMYKGCSGMRDVHKNSGKLSIMNGVRADSKSPALHTAV